jgi:hypothetical protein
MNEQRSGPGRKPDVKIAIKPKQPKEAKRTYIAAGWREDGKLRLKFDRDIAAIVLTDGTQLQCADLYVDLYEDAPGQSSSRPGNGTKRAAPRGNDAAPTHGAADDFGDDIPF